MEIIFRNTTTYNLEEYKKFLQFHNRKYNTRYYSYTLFIVLLLSFCIVLQFRYQNTTLGILFVLILLCFIFYRTFYPIFFVKKEANSKKITKQMTNTYVFYDKYVLIRNKSHTINLKYSKFYKIFETKNCFYLYLNKNYAFVLNKNNFDIGDKSQFYDFVKSKIWFNFIPFI